MRATAVAQTADRERAAAPTQPVPPQDAAPRPLAVRGLTVRFGDLTVVEDLSLEVQAGELVALVGPSGCGKSTCLNAISGLLRPGGDVAVDGEVTVADGVRLAYAFQKDALLPWSTARRNVEVGAELAGVPRAERRAIATELLGQVGLKGFEGRYPHQLSGGMRQRVALARVLAYDPDLILMDEPFGALDAFIRMSLQNQLLDVWARTRKTMVLVTHDLVEALILGTRVVVLSPSPGRVHAVVDNREWPEDRRAETLRSTPEFLEKYRKLWETMIELGAAQQTGEEPR
ncbi:MAG: NitT/TauT family transport system ATP-binding protein [Solirubrobacteraceae bacterium]|jgi:NitT/TauT family transport system ATP-binding protein|nr:NitT/TauT family transport system ATP-binding protein [Solirubrobacteraceae bacterium]